MSHLLAGLLRLGDPLLVITTAVEALLGCTLAFLVHLPPEAERTFRRPALLFGPVVALTAWSVFKTALHGSFPDLPLSTPFTWGAPAFGFAVLGCSIASLMQREGRRSARTAMLSGSLAASGLSCMLFTAMAGMVQPFALAYDLAAVLITTVGTSALFAFAFWVESNQDARYRRIKAIGLASLATIGSCAGSLAAILPFEGWMNALSEPDDLSSAPLVIIVASEAAIVLALSLFGSLVDNRTAARDRLETERLRELAGSTFEAIVIHRDGVVLDGNSILADLIGRPLPALIGRSLSEFCPEAALPLFEAVTEGSARPAQIQDAKGTAIPVEILSRSISYDGLPARASALRDVRERNASEARIRFLAHHDPLTGLPNRALMTETLLETLEQSVEGAASFFVFCLDLDGFKLVNDTLGHAAGDTLLCQVAARIQENVRADDFISRLGGDEFVVLLRTKSSPAHATNLAQRLVASLAEPFHIGGKEVQIGTSIGISCYPSNGQTSDTLLRNADIALYRAKQEGRGTHCFFEEQMGFAVQQQGEIERALPGALERGEFSLQYQPIFSAKKVLISFEALLRWTHPVIGSIAPSQFIPLAEKSGAILALGEWALRSACRVAQEWPDHYRLVVNISPRQLLRGNLDQVVSRVLLDTGFPPTRLELEIAESAIVSHREAATATLTALRKRGIRLALDNFGTGYSSLPCLHDFPFDKLKVDRSFVQRVDTDESARSIVRAIAAMCTSLNITTSAQGVETPSQLEVLRAEQFQEFQGFLLGHPMSAAAVEPFIAAQEDDEPRLRRSA